MSEQEVVAALRWNNNAGVPIITLMLYEYLLLLDKEINYVWKQPWSVMSCLYLVMSFSLLESAYGFCDFICRLR